MKPWNENTLSRLSDLINELQEKLKAPVIEKYNNAREVCKAIEADPLPFELAKLLFKDFQRLMFYELRKYVLPTLFSYLRLIELSFRSIDLVKTIIGFFEFLLHKPIDVEIPSPPAPVQEMCSSSTGFSTSETLTSSDGSITNPRLTTSSMRLSGWGFQSLPIDKSLDKSEEIHQDNVDLESDQLESESFDAEVLRDHFEKELKEYMTVSAQLMGNILSQIEENLSIKVSC